MERKGLPESTTAYKIITNAINFDILQYATVPCYINNNDNNKDYYYYCYLLINN